MGRLTELRDFIEGDRTADEAKASYVHLIVDAEARAARREYRVQVRKRRARVSEPEDSLFDFTD